MHGVLDVKHTSPRCPEVTDSGSAKGPCLCRPPRTVAPEAPHTRLGPIGGLWESGATPTELRRVEAVTKARADLKAAGRHWKNAREWALSTGWRPADVKAVNPLAVEAYLTALAAESA